MGMVARRGAGGGFRAASLLLLLLLLVVVLRPAPGDRMSLQNALRFGHASITARSESACSDSD
jgi:hypothetical protein